MRFLRCLLAIIAVTVLAAVHAAEAKPVKYVFLFIGDGMSIPQRMMTDEFLNRTEKRGLLINRFPGQAITTTMAADSFITDSAASGTAIACGERPTTAVSAWMRPESANFSPSPKPPATAAARSAL